MRSAAVETRLPARATGRAQKVTAGHPGGPRSERRLGAGARSAPQNERLSMRRASTILASALAVVALVGWATPAEAAGNPQKAQRLVRKAEGQLRAGNYEDALKLYQSAYDMAPAPTVLCMIGRAYQLLGNPEEALGRYRDCLKDELPEALRGRIQTEFEKINKEYGKAWLSFDIEPVGALVQLDGESLGAAPLDRVQVKPGDHIVEVRADGYLPETDRFTVVADEDRIVTVALRPVPPPEVPVPVVTVAPRSPYHPWQWVALGLGGALIVAGGTVYALAQGDYDKADSGRKKHTMDYAEGSDLYDAGNTKRLAGGALLGAGGAVLAGAAVLLALDLTWKPPQPVEDGATPASSLPPVSSLDVQPLPDGAVLRLGGRF